MRCVLKGASLSCRHLQCHALFYPSISMFSHPTDLGLCSILAYSSNASSSEMKSTTATQETPMLTVTILCRARWKKFKRLQRNENIHATLKLALWRNKWGLLFRVWSECVSSGLSNSGRVLASDWACCTEHTDHLSVDITDNRVARAHY